MKNKNMKKNTSTILLSIFCLLTSQFSYAVENIPTISSLPTFNNSLPTSSTTVQTSTIPTQPTVPSETTSSNTGSTQNTTSTNTSSTASTSSTSSTIDTDINLKADMMTKTTVLPMADLNNTSIKTAQDAINTSSTVVLEPKQDLPPLASSTTTTPSTTTTTTTPDTTSSTVVLEPKQDLPPLASSTTTTPSTSTTTTTPNTTTVQDGCQSNNDCDDDNNCTNDQCNFTIGTTIGKCSHSNIVCNDSDECTADSCNASLGCEYKKVPNSINPNCGKQSYCGDGIVDAQEECDGEAGVTEGSRCNGQCLLVTLPPCADGATAKGVHCHVESTLTGEVIVCEDVNGNVVRRIGGHKQPHAFKQTPAGTLYFKDADGLAYNQDLANGKVSRISQLDKAQVLGFAPGDKTVAVTNTGQVFTLSSSGKKDVLDIDQNHPMSVGSNGTLYELDNDQIVSYTLKTNGYDMSDIIDLSGKIDGTSLAHLATYKHKMVLAGPDKTFIYDLQTKDIQTLLTPNLSYVTINNLTGYVSYADTAGKVKGFDIVNTSDIIAGKTITGKIKDIVQTVACEATEEVCDGVDNNGDGQIDEGVSNACGTCGELTEECSNGLDDDCNGVTDEGCGGCDDGDTSDCGSDVGACKMGLQSCVNGLWSDQCEGATKPVDEICDDNIDNNCNGEVDENCSKPSPEKKTDTLDIPSDIDESSTPIIDLEPEAGCADTSDIHLTLSDVRQLQEHGLLEKAGATISYKNGKALVGCAQATAGSQFVGGCSLRRGL